ncbi:chemotaxis protein CheB [Phormidium tenue FACHB-886]|nr:chemotaxis protein CheB [Phormidium tenue FACHB-886]
MPGHDIIVIGASAGGIEALIKLISRLPSDLPAAIFIVVHFPSWSKSFMPKILNKEAKLYANHASDREAIEHGRIYIPLPDCHLLVKRGYVRLAEGPKENGFRPAIDALFRTAANAYRQRVVGIVLSGALDDGTAGLMDIKRLGGVAVVQNPDEALFASMPQSAIEHVAVDRVLPITEIAAELVRLAYEPVSVAGEQPISDLQSSENEMEPDIVELDGAELRNLAIG